MKNKVIETIRLLKLLSEIEQDEMNLIIRGGRGYAAGHPYKKPGVKPGYGVVSITDDDIEPPEVKKVEISRAFLKRE